MVAKKLKGILPVGHLPPLQAYSSGLHQWLSKFSRFAPFLLYANMNFEAASAGDIKELMECEWQLRHAGWTDARILNFLKKHQEEFRRCLNWVAGGCFVDPGEQSADDESPRENWEKAPEVNFLRQHGFEHAGVTIGPYWGSEDLSGLQLVQKKPRDPLDPIVWDVIAHLSVYGTVAVRRCRYSRCGKFFRPKTQRKRFCSDSCRALGNVPSELSGGIDSFREKRKKYMRDYRQNPQVKKRIPKSSSSSARKRATGRKSREKGPSLEDLLIAELTKPQNSTATRIRKRRNLIRKRNRVPGSTKNA